MHLKHSIQDNSQTLFYNDVISSLYLPAFLSYLRYNDLILRLGRTDNIYPIVFLGALEIIKYIHYANTKGLKNVFRSVVACSVSFGTVYTVAVLFGAPAFSDFQETGMFALIITVLTALPVSLHLGLTNTLSMFLSITSSEGTEIQKLFLLKVRLVLFGAWLGATVIPLDWQRPWQEWPIPCSLAAMMGYTVATWLCALTQYSSRRKSFKKSGKYAL